MTTAADNGVGMNYTLSEPNVLPIYEAARQDPDVSAQVICLWCIGVNSGIACAGVQQLRVLVYNGDTDPGINSFVTQHKYMDYFDSLGVNESEAWRPWTYAHKIYPSIPALSAKPRVRTPQSSINFPKTHLKRASNSGKQYKKRVMRAVFALLPGPIGMALRDKEMPGVNPQLR